MQDDHENNMLSIQVLERYLIICNQVIDENKERFPYQEVWKACAEELSGEQVLLGVKEIGSKVMLSVCWHLGQFHWQLICHDTSQNENTYFLSSAEIDAVLEDPRKFIHDPYLINWGWLEKIKP